VLSCSATGFHRRVADAIPEELQVAILPVLGCLQDLERRIRELDRSIERVMTARHPDWRLLQQVNGVAPLTSAAFVLTIGDPSRFRRSRDVGACAGLCPKKRQSGDRDPQLSITKRGNGFRPPATGNRCQLHSRTLRQGLEPAAVRPATLRAWRPKREEARRRRRGPQAGGVTASPLGFARQVRTPSRCDLPVTA
jgi:hypothetical protein